jgi:hypothetical protein
VSPIGAALPAGDRPLNVCSIYPAQGRIMKAAIEFLKQASDKFKEAFERR